MHHAQEEGVANRVVAVTLHVNVLLGHTQRHQLLAHERRLRHRIPGGIHPLGLVRGAAAVAHDARRECVRTLLLVHIGRFSQPTHHRLVWQTSIVDAARQHDEQVGQRPLLGAAAHDKKNRCQDEEADAGRNFRRTVAPHVNLQMSKSAAAPTHKPGRAPSSSLFVGFTTTA